MRNSLPFVQFKKREKHPWKSNTFSEVARFSLQLCQKYYSSMGVFTFFKLYKWYQLAQSFSYDTFVAIGKANNVMNLDISYIEVLCMAVTCIMCTDNIPTSIFIMQSAIKAPDQPFNFQCSHHIETHHWIGSAN